MAEQDEQSIDFESSIMDKRKIMGLQDAASENTNEGKNNCINKIICSYMSWLIHGFYYNHL